jgi:hypothetical protein
VLLLCQSEQCGVRHVQGAGLVVLSQSGTFLTSSAGMLPAVQACYPMPASIVSRFVIDFTTNVLGTLLWCCLEEWLHGGKGKKKLPGVTLQQSSMKEVGSSTMRKSISLVWCWLLLLQHGALAGECHQQLCSARSTDAAWVARCKCKVMQMQVLL